MTARTYDGQPLTDTDEPEVEKCSRCDKIGEPLILASTICGVCGPDPICPACSELHQQEKRSKGDWWVGAARKDSNV